MNEDFHNIIAELINRGFVWFGKGIEADIFGTDLINLAFYGPLLEKAKGFRLEDEIERRKKIMLEEQIISEQKLNLAEIPSANINTDNHQTGALQPATKAALIVKTNEPTDIRKWLNILKRPSVILILGKRGSGKSALGYWLLELLRCQRKPCVFNVPETAATLLPEYIGIVNNLADLTPGDVLLVEEAQLPFSSRGNLKVSRELSELISLSRQKGLILIFVTQEARKVDKSIASAVDIIIIKQPGFIQPGFDRPELKSIFTKANQSFAEINGEKSKWSYVCAPDAGFEGMLENDLADFWSEKLSCAFADVIMLSPPRVAKEQNKEEMASRAKEIYLKVRSYRKGALTMGVKEGTFYNLVNDYPYYKKKKTPINRTDNT